MFLIIAFALMLCGFGAQLYQVIKTSNAEDLSLITQLCLLVALMFGAAVGYPDIKEVTAEHLIVGLLYTFSIIICGITTVLVLVEKLKERPTAGNVQRKAEEVLAFFMDLSAEQRVRFVSVAKLISEKSFNYVAFLKYALQNIRER